MVEGILDKIVKDEKFDYPVVISIIGPRKTGKTTLIKSIASHFLKNFDEYQCGNLLIFSKIGEPFIFIESPLESLSISNLTKISDIAILVIDCFFGLELETFECISFLNSHGTPRIVCVLTHLDVFTNWKTLKKSKKRIKTRLKKELGSHLKIFFMSGISFNQRYLGREISNITRFFSFKGIRPSFLQTNSSYMICSKLNSHETNGEKYTVVSGFLRGKRVEATDELTPISPGLGKIKLKKLLESKVERKYNNIGLSQSKFSSKKELSKKKSKRFLIKSGLILKNKKIDQKTVFFLFLHFKLIIKKKLVFFKFSNFFDSSKINHGINSTSLKKFHSSNKKKLQIRKQSKKLGEEKNFDESVTKSFKNLELKAKNKSITKSTMVFFLELQFEKFSKNFFRWFETFYPFFFFLETGLKKKKLLKGKVYRHKWNKKIIKSREGVFLSFGWDFFKTSIYFLSEKENKKSILNKNLKKSAFSLVCFRSRENIGKAGLVGIFHPVFNFSKNSKGIIFNIIFTGFFLGPVFEEKIFKKVKLKGYVFRVFEKTAFVKNIFSSEIEVLRFLGNFITGEKGERGLIKKPIKKKPSGSFRALFNQKMAIKQTVFLRLFIPLKFRDKLFKSSFFLYSWDKREIHRT